MKLVTWNVNSLGVRMPRVLEFLDEHAPDVLCLQETKTEDAAFPVAELAGAGYDSVHHSAGRWAGVAILARQGLGLRDAVAGLPGEAVTDEARFIEATAGDMRVASAYVTNGRAVGTEWFDQKLTFLDAMAARAKALHDAGEPVVMAGDFNVTRDDRDVYDPAAFVGDTHVTPDERTRLERILTDGGLTDAYRSVHPDDVQFTWWDYRAGQLPQGPRAADRLHPAQRHAGRRPDRVRDRARLPQGHEAVRPRPADRRAQPSVARATGMTRSAPARRSWPPTIASVQPEWRRSSSRTPTPGGGVVGHAERAADVGGLLGGVGHLALRRALARCARRASGTARRARRRRGRPSPSSTSPTATRRHARDPVDRRAGAAHEVGQRRRRHRRRTRPRCRPRSIAGHQPPSPNRASAQPGSMRTSSGILRIDAGGVGRHLLDLELDRRRAQVALRPARPAPDRAAAAKRGAVQTEQRPQSAAPDRRAPPAGRRIRQRPSAPNAAIAVLLGAPQRGDLGVALAVVGPVRVGDELPARARRACTAPSTSRIFSIASMPAHAEVHDRHQLARGAALRRRPPRARRAPPSPARGDGNACSMKKSWMPAVLAAAQQDDVGVIDAAARAADLLVVGDDRARRLVVHDEASGRPCRSPSRARWWRRPP